MQDEHGFGEIVMRSCVLPKHVGAAQPAAADGGTGSGTRGGPAVAVGATAFGVTCNPAVAYAADLLGACRRHGDVLGSHGSARCVHLLTPTRD